MLACCQLSVLHAAILLDDTWADGTRTEQNLPTESAWFASNGSALVAAANSMTLSVADSAVLGLTYFTTDENAPVHLEVGDLLTTTLTLSFSGVAAPNGSQGFRMALCDFADSTLSPQRLSADGFSNSSQGDGVEAYALFQNLGTVFNNTDPMDLRKRTNLADSSLLGSSGDWTSISKGPGDISGFPGFVDDVFYTLRLAVRRTASDALMMSAIWSNTVSGAVLSNAVTDPNADSFNFDGLALRPLNASTSASSITFHELKVEITWAAPTAPSISAQPQDQSVAEGAVTVMHVVAGGSAPLTYSWYFNTNTVVSSGPNSDWVITNTQPENAGAYFVVVTNSVGSITSKVAVLTVNTNPLPPAITVQPKSLTAPVGQSATLKVETTGAEPFSYQWMRLPGTLVAQATGPTLTLVPLTQENAGDYFVVVTNAAGSVTSEVATLTISSSLAEAPQFDLEGFAALDGFATNSTLLAGGTIGGAGGDHIQVSTLGELANALQSTAPLRVELVNDIDLSSLANNSGGFPADYPTGEILVRSHKTIYSKNGSAIRRGTLRIGKPSLGPQQDIIIRNLKFRDLWVFDPSGNYDTYGWDYIHIEGGSHHIWVDHCDFDHVYDGMIDVTHGSDLVTASWNVFRDQKKCCLIGHSDNNAAEDTGHLNVTFHHNWFVDVDERMPRMRFGNAHVFNLYCENLGGKGIQSTADAATLVENSLFYHPKAGSFPTIEANGGPTGIVKVVNSRIDNLPSNNVQFREYGQDVFQFNPPYAGSIPPYPYTLDPLTNVASVVTNYAGVGRVGFELWQMKTFPLVQLTNAAVSGRAADPDNDGFNNYQEYLAGTNPTNAASLLRITSAVLHGKDMVVSWKTGAGRVCVVQAAAGASTGPNGLIGFTNVSLPIVIPGSGDVVTNFVDVGAATSPGVRFYRVLATP